MESGDEGTESAAPSDGGLTTDASDAPIDDLDSQGPACDAGLSLCSLGCVDTKTNDLNCGQCDNACSTGFSCTDASCECSEGTTLCNQQCANLVSDQANCGACGHNCEGSSCVAGLCQPTVVAAPNAVIGGIAVTATTTYFTASRQGGAIESKAFGDRQPDSSRVARGRSILGTLRRSSRYRGRLRQRLLGQLRERGDHAFRLTDSPGMSRRLFGMAVRWLPVARWR